MKPFTGALCAICSAPSAESLPTIQGRPNLVLPRCCPGSSWIQLPPKTPLIISEDFHLANMPADYKGYQAAQKRIFESGGYSGIAYKAFDKNIVLCDTNDRLFPVLAKDFMKSFAGKSDISLENTSLYAARKGGYVYWIPIV